MVKIHSIPLKRNFFAPWFSGATLFVAVMYIGLIVFAFLIAYFTHGLWLKESSYREQPIVVYMNTMFVKLQGFNGDWQHPIDLSYSSFSNFNQFYGPDVRVPEVRVSTEDLNLDLIADVIHITLRFQTAQSESITQFQGIFFFRYMLRNRVRLDTEAPVLLQYSAGVPGRSLLMDGRMTLNVANPLPVLPSVQGVNNSILPLYHPGPVPIGQVSFSNLVSQMAGKNTTFTLESVGTSWESKFAACEPNCGFSVKATFRIPNQLVLYTPTFIEVAKFSWIQFLATFIFLLIFARPLINFALQHQVVQTVTRDDLPKQKLL